MPAERILSIKLLTGFETLEDLFNVWLLDLSCSSHGQKKVCHDLLSMLTVKAALSIIYGPCFLISQIPIDNVGR